MVSDRMTPPQQAADDVLANLSAAGDGPDDAGPGAGGGLVVRCPREPLPVRAGCRLYAVEYDVNRFGEEDALLAFATLRFETTDLCLAVTVANGLALDRRDLPALPGANAVEVWDGRGVMLHQAARIHPAA